MDFYDVFYLSIFLIHLSFCLSVWLDGWISMTFVRYLLSYKYKSFCTIIMIYILNSVAQSSMDCQNNRRPFSILCLSGTRPHVKTFPKAPLSNLLENSGTAPIDPDQSRARGQISDLVPVCLGPDRQGRGQMRQCQY